MSRVFVVPDVHLKPWIFEKASELISAGSYDTVAMLGDLVDDWDQEQNLDLYNKTFDAAIEFAEKYPETLWCYGNHDVSYVWEAMESGYSDYARETVVKRLRDLENTVPEGKFAFIHKKDNVLFSHAGLTKSFVKYNFQLTEYPTDYDLYHIISEVNKMGKAELWQDDSPIWARPQYGRMARYPDNLLQVVGHTPVREVLNEKNFLTLDTFSTYRDGRPIGDERFVWVDTVAKTWEYAK